jgi:hypothetical protein
VSEHIRPEIAALIARGNITLTELNELRCNSWEWQAMVPAMNDEAFVDRMEYALKNCFTPARRPFSTYNEAVEGLWAPQLIRRYQTLRERLHDFSSDMAVEIKEFEASKREACNYAETLDAVREALGQKETHYLCIPDDVGIAVRALEWFATKSQFQDHSTRARAALAVIRHQADHVECGVCKKKLIVIRDDRVPAVFCEECGGGCESVAHEEIYGDKP